MELTGWRRGDEGSQGDFGGVMCVVDTYMGRQHKARCIDILTDYIESLIN